MAWRVGVDIGGTFTDVAVVEEASGRIGVAKQLTTPENFARGVFEALGAALQKYEIASTEVSFLSHATTVVTNALLESKGADVASISTDGFRDLLELRRSARSDLYDMFQDAPATLVPRHRRFEITERISAEGDIVTPLDLDQVDQLIVQIRASGAQAIAVCLLHAFVNDCHERLLGERLRAALPEVAVYLSSEVLPEIREFERSSTTAVCAYVGPILASYLQGLESQTRAMGLPRLYIMGSAGGVFDVAESLRMPAMAVESGPAAGVIAAQLVSRELGLPNLISFDMGGTTAKASLIEGGAFATTAEYEVGGGANVSRWLHGTGHPIRVPVIDLAEVSAGGGSIAWVDAGGALRVGPHSAGALPGPACYGRGGSDSTVTDCNVAMGYLHPQSLLAGNLQVDLQAARTAIEHHLAQPLGLSIEAAASAVIEVVNASMAEALRIVSVERGHDAREFSLVAFGGAGPIHATALAEELEIPQVVVPPAPGAFSALGLVATDMRREYSQTFYLRSDQIDSTSLRRAFKTLEQRASQLVAESELGDDQFEFSYSVDCRYPRQAYELNIEFDQAKSDSLATLCHSFHERHRTTYGHANPNEPVQLVNLRLAAIGRLAPLALREQSDSEPKTAQATAERSVRFGRGEPTPCPVYSREALPASHCLVGPAVIESLDSTVVVPPGWQCVVNGLGFLLLTRIDEGKS